MLTSQSRLYESIHGANFRILQTIVLRNSRPHAWYFTSSGGIIKRKHQRNCTVERVLNEFRVRYPDDDDDDDIVARLSSSNLADTAAAAAQLLSLRDVVGLLQGEKGQNEREAVLQVLPSRHLDDSKKPCWDSVIKAQWSPPLCILERHYTPRDSGSSARNEIERSVGSVTSNTIVNQIHSVCAALAAVLSDPAMHMLVEFTLDFRGRVCLLGALEQADVPPSDLAHKQQLMRESRLDSELEKLAKNDARLSSESRQIHLSPPRSKEESRHSRSSHAHTPPTRKGVVQARAFGGSDGKPTAPDTEKRGRRPPPPKSILGHRVLKSKAETSVAASAVTNTMVTSAPNFPVKNVDTLRCVYRVEDGCSGEGPLSPAVTTGRCHRKNTSSRSRPSPLCNSPSNLSADPGGIDVLVGLLRAQTVGMHQMVLRWLQRGHENVSGRNDSCQKSDPAAAPQMIDTQMGALRRLVDECLMTLDINHISRDMLHKLGFWIVDNAGDTTALRTVASRFSDHCGAFEHRLRRLLKRRAQHTFRGLADGRVPSVTALLQSELKHATGSVEVASGTDSGGGDCAAAAAAAAATDTSGLPGAGGGHWHVVVMSLLGDLVLTLQNRLVNLAQRSSTQPEVLSVHSVNTALGKTLCRLISTKQRVELTRWLNCQGPGAFAFDSSRVPEISLCCEVIRAYWPHNH